MAPTRSRTCCRHFLLAQLRDGRHVVLGENSAHARLQDLLRHYTVCPLSPYGETITKPLARQVRLLLFLLTQHPGTQIPAKVSFPEPRPADSNRASSPTLQLPHRPGKPLEKAEKAVCWERELERPAWPHRQEG